jgi:HEAT repeat protein
MKLSKHPYDSSAYEKVKSYLKDRDAFIRNIAVQGLTQAGIANASKTPEVITLLCASLTDDSAQVVRRQSALSITLINIRTLPIEQALANALTNHPNEDTAWFAAEALGKLGATNSTDALESALRYEGMGIHKWTLQEYAAEAFYRVSSLLPAKSLKRQENLSPKASLYVALGCLRNDSDETWAVGALVEVLRSSERTLIAKCLSELRTFPKNKTKDPSLQEAINMLRNSEDPEIAASAQNLIFR